MKRWVLGAAALTLGACATVETEVSERDTDGAYMIVLGTVHDREAFMSGYAAELPPIYEKYGGRYLALGGGPNVVEGDVSYQSYVISAWPDVETAQAFWNSPEYDVLRRARIDNAWGEFDILIVPSLSAPNQ